jgi:hypothetical protein
MKSIRRIEFPQALAFLATLSGAFLLASPAAIAGPAAVVDYVHVDGFEAPVDCTQDLACSAPASGRVCLAGRISEAGTSRPMQAFRNAERPCADGAIGGACDLRLRTYDAIELASNPSGAPELSASIYVDGCARFRITDQMTPALGFLAVVADDASSLPEHDFHVPSVLFRPVSANAQIEDQELVVARRDTVAGWTQSAGAPFGADSFADVGVILFRFRASAVPAPGVTVQRDGSTQAALDWYFTDAGTSARSQVSGVAMATGPNGSALITGGSLSTYSGTGGEPGGCTWPSVNAAAIPGYVVFVPFEC